MNNLNYFPIYKNIFMQKHKERKPAATAHLCIYKIKKMLVPDENFAISTYRLQGDCSTSELIRNILLFHKQPLN